MYSVCKKLVSRAGWSRLWQVMERDAAKMRGMGAVVFSQAKHGVGVDEIVSHVLSAWEHATGAHTTAA